MSYICGMINAKKQKAMKGLKYYIAERHNPQFDKPYYRAKGQMTKADARKAEDCLYGSVYMIEFPNEEAYRAQIKELLSTGFRVNGATN